MELKIYRDTMHTLGVLGDVQTEIPVESEILIPDYLPPVFKIIKTLIHRVVLQKQIQAGHILLEGYLRAEVFYQGEDQRLYVIEQKIAFSRQQDLKGFEEKRIDRINVYGEVQYVNCRAVSPRRLDLRGAYNLSARIFGGEEKSLITAMAESGIQQKYTVLPSAQMVVSREKQFTMEAHFSFDHPVEQVLHIRPFFRVQDVHIVAGKAVVKGECKAEILYRTAESETMCRQEVLLPLHQVVEMDRAEESFECRAVFESVGCALQETSGEEEKVCLNCTCLMTVCAVKATEFVGVGDCFSTTYQTETSYGKFESDTLEEILSNDISVRIEGALPDDSLEVLQCFAEYGMPELISEKEQTLIRGKVTAHLLCRNALGEIDCYDKNGEYVLPKKYPIAIDLLTADLNVACQGIQFSQKESSVSVELALRVQGILYRKQLIEVLEEVACTQPLEKKSDVSLRVYYAAEGEAVFDIAKRYHASPADISALAGIDGERLKSKAQLLIPQTW